MELRIDAFRDLSAFITSYSLRLILGEYKRPTDQPTVLPACTKSFSTLLGLPCAHVIQERLATTSCLLIADVHPHWRFDKSDVSTIIAATNDSLLHIYDSEVVRTRGRPMGSENRTRREEAFEESTIRQPSQFQQVEGEIANHTGEVLDETIAQALIRANPAPRRRGRPRVGRRTRGVRSRGRGCFGGGELGDVMNSLNSSTTWSIILSRHVDEIMRC